MTADIEEFCRVACLKPDAARVAILGEILGASASEVGLVGPGAAGVLHEAVLAWLFLSGETVLWATKRAATAESEFRAVAELLAGSKELRSGVQVTRKANGAQEISMQSGARVLFRTWDRARGYSAGRLIVGDANVIGQRQVALLIPVLLGRNAGRGQVVFTANELAGSVLESLRARATDASRPLLLAA